MSIFFNLFEKHSNWLCTTKYQKPFHEKKMPHTFFHQRISREEHEFFTKNISCNKKNDYRSLKSYMSDSYVRSHCTQPGILMFEDDDGSGDIIITITTYI